jgi:hypothetical protein
MLPEFGEEESMGNGGDEHTSLLRNRISRTGGQSRSGPPWWVRIPYITLHTVTRICRFDYFNILLPVIPVSIVAGALGWHPITVFVLNLLSLLPLKATLNFALDESLLPVTNTAANGALCSLVEGLLGLIVSHLSLSPNIH